MANIATEIFGNVSVSGFVNNLNTEKRFFLLGTGAYLSRDGEKKYKASVMVFLDRESSVPLPTEGAYVEVKGDLSISETTYKPHGSDKQHVRGTMNVRTAYQLQVKPAPTKRQAATEAAPTADDDI